MGSTKASACLVEAFFINPPQTPPLIVRDATEQRRTVLEQLWTMFRHDMSWLACVDEDGMFKGYVTLRGVRSQLAETYRDA